MTIIDETVKHRKAIAKERLLICRECDKYNDTTTQCKECGCVMLFKTFLPNSTCPLNKWGADTENFNKDN